MAACPRPIALILSALATTGLGLVAPLQQAALVGTLDGHTAPVYAIAWTPDGKTIITGGFDNTVRVWDAASRKEHQKFAATQSRTLGRASARTVQGTSPAASTRASASGLAPGAAPGRKSRACPPASTPSPPAPTARTPPRPAATGSRSGIWPLPRLAASKAPRRSSRSPGGATPSKSPPATRPAPSGSGTGRRRLAGTDRDALRHHPRPRLHPQQPADHLGRLRRPRPPLATTSRGSEGHRREGAGESGLRQPDGGKLATAGDDKIVRIWNGPDGALVKEIPGPRDRGRRRPQGRRRAGRLRPGEQGRSASATSATASRSRRSRTCPRPITALAFQLDGALDRLGRRGQPDPRLQRRRRQGGQGDGRPRCDGSTPWHVRPQRRQPARTPPRPTRRAKLWNVNEGEAPSATSPATATRCSSLALTRDGQRLATGSADKTAHGSVTRSATPSCCRTLSATAGRSRRSPFSNDNNKLVASGSADNMVRFWDVANPAAPRELQDLSDHGAAIVGVAVLPDNAQVVSAGADNKVRVWKPAAVRVFAGHQGPVLRGRGPPQRLAALPPARPTRR